jgi:hypothetical protein
MGVALLHRDPHADRCARKLARGERANSEPPRGCHTSRTAHRKGCEAWNACFQQVFRLHFGQEIGPTAPTKWEIGSLKKN